MLHNQSLVLLLFLSQRFNLGRHSVYLLLQGVNLPLMFREFVILDAFQVSFQITQLFSLSSLACLQFIDLSLLLDNHFSKIREAVVSLNLIPQQNESTSFLTDNGSLRIEVTRLNVRLKQL